MDIERIKNDDIDRISSKYDVLERFCEISQKASKHLTVEFEPGIYYRPVASCFCHAQHPSSLFSWDFDEHLMKFIEDAVDAKIAGKDPATLQARIDELEAQQKHAASKQSHGCLDMYCVKCDG